jgi:lipopolysaccharide biosynthesis glycosyltransferase
MINIYGCTDENYAQHLCVCFMSIAKNTKENITFYVIYEQIADKTIQKFKKSFYNIKHCKTKFVKISESVFKNLKVDGHASRAIYYRLIAPQIINEKYLLYIDCDIICTTDINNLWSFPLDGKIIAAKQDPYGLHYKNIAHNLGVEKYFNSGVMKIDTKKWNTANITDKTIDFIKNNPDKIVFWDQDGLNYILQKKWKNLPAELNFGSFTVDYYKLKKISPVNKILHFNGPLKPWHFWCNHPYKNEYYIYVEFTEWKSFKPPFSFKGVDIKEVSIYFIKLILRNILTKKTYARLIRKNDSKN